MFTSCARPCGQLLVCESVPHQALWPVPVWQLNLPKRVGDGQAQHVSRVGSGQARQGEQAGGRLHTIS